MAISLKRFLRIVKWVFVGAVATVMLTAAAVYFILLRPYAPTSFDKEGWDKADLSSNGAGRCRYADDLIHKKLIPGKTTRTEVIAMLGKEYAVIATECERSISYDIGWCSMMDGHTLDVCFDTKDVVISARNVQH